MGNMDVAGTVAERSQKRNDMQKIIAAGKAATPPEIASTVCGWCMWLVGHVCSESARGIILFFLAIGISIINLQLCVSRKKRADVELERARLKLKHECEES